MWRSCEEQAIYKEASDYPHVVQMTPTPCHKAVFIEHSRHKTTYLDKCQNIQLSSDTWLNWAVESIYGLKNIWQNFVFQFKSLTWVCFFVLHWHLFILLIIFYAIKNKHVVELREVHRPSTLVIVMSRLATNMRDANTFSNQKWLDQESKGRSVNLTIFLE